MATDTVDPALLPKEGVKYPLKVDYCPNCSMPFEVRMLQARGLFILKYYFAFQKLSHLSKRKPVNLLLV